MIASEYQAEKVNIDQRKQFILMDSSQMATTDSGQIVTLIKVISGMFRSDTLMSSWMRSFQIKEKQNAGSKTVRGKNARLKAVINFIVKLGWMCHLSSCRLTAVSFEWIKLKNYNHNYWLCWTRAMEIFLTFSRTRTQKYDHHHRSSVAPLSLEHILLLVQTAAACQIINKTSWPFSMRPSIDFLSNQ